MTRPDGSTPWRSLAGLAALVVAVHVLVLQASPSRLGAKFDQRDNDVRAFSTRRIEAPPAQAIPEPAVAARPRPARKKVAAAASPSPQNEQNEPAASENIALSAIDSIAKQAPQADPGLSATTPTTPTTLTTTAAATPTSAEPAAVQSAGTDAIATPLAQAGQSLPSGPATTAVTAVALPPSVLLEYKMVGTSKGLNYQANAELYWRNGGGQYDASMKVSALFVGARSMTSSGQITPLGLAPTRFADKFRSELAAHFLPEQRKIVFSANTPDAPWIEGAQDRVSVFLQLAGMFAAKPADFPPGSEISLYTIGPREADTWTFVVETGEKLNIQGAEMATLKVIRKPRREYDQKVEIWFAPSLGYLPVRNRITQQNGDFIDQHLSSISRP